MWDIVPFVYIDAGYADVTDDTFSNPIETLMSTGIGVYAYMQHGIYMTSYIGIPLIEGPFTDSGSPAFYLAASKVW